MTTPTRYNNTHNGGWLTTTTTGITKTQKDVDRASRQSYRNVIVHRLHMSGSDDTGRRRDFYFLFFFLGGGGILI